jgi:hypothetical protein
MINYWGMIPYFSGKRKLQTNAIAGVNRVNCPEE